MNAKPFFLNQDLRYTQCKLFNAKTMISKRKKYWLTEKTVETKGSFTENKYCILQNAFFINMLHMYLVRFQ